MFKYAPTNSNYRKEAQQHKLLFNDKIIKKLVTKEEKEQSSETDESKVNDGVINNKNLVIQPVEDNFEN